MFEVIVRTGYIFFHPSFIRLSLMISICGCNSKSVIIIARKLVCKQVSLCVNVSEREIENVHFNVCNHEAETVLFQGQLWTRMLMISCHWRTFKRSPSCILSKKKIKSECKYTTHPYSMSRKRSTTQTSGLHKDSFTMSRTSKYEIRGHTLVRVSASKCDLML